MSCEETAQVWDVGPDGRFVARCPKEDAGNRKDTCDTGPELEIVLSEDPHAICPVCRKPVKAGDTTLVVVRWDRMYADQTEDYPIYGLRHPVHLGCLIKNRNEKKRP